MKSLKNLWAAISSIYKTGELPPPEPVILDMKLYILDTGAGDALVLLARNRTHAAHRVNSHWQSLGLDQRFRFIKVKPYFFREFEIDKIANVIGDVYSVPKEKFHV